MASAAEQLAANFNFGAIAKAEELKKQVHDLSTTNEFLLDQNAQLRLGVKASTTVVSALHSGIPQISVQPPQAAPPPPAAAPPPAPQTPTAAAAAAATAPPPQPPPNLPPPTSMVSIAVPVQPPAISIAGRSRKLASRSP